MKKESDVHETVDEVFHRFGVPNSLISDQAKSLTQSKFKPKARQAGCPCDVTDPYSPWMNSAEGEIREVKRMAGGWQVAKQSPRVLWDYCVELASKVPSDMPNSVHKLDGESPETVIFGETARPYHTSVSTVGMIGSCSMSPHTHFRSTRPS
jgi:hypothetical protein